MSTRKPSRHFFFLLSLTAKELKGAQGSNYWISCNQVLKGLLGIWWVIVG